MSLSLPGRVRAEMNLTPMIDVLLVLIIIFMLITPTTSHGLEALVPQPHESAPARSEIVITVRTDGTVQLNRESMDLRALESRLGSLFRNGTNQAIFLRGDRDLEFARIAQVIDLARGVGAYRVGLMTN